MNQIAREIMLLLVHSLHEKISPEAKTDEILKVCATYL